MNFWGEILKWLSFRIEPPKVFGFFHIFSLLLTVFLSALLLRVLPKPSESTVRKLLIIASAVILALEIYKQIVFSFQYLNGEIVFEYPWYIFPFQFCSTPLYVGFLCGFIRNKKIHKSLCAFIASYSCLAGVGVMLYPEGSFCSVLGVNVQTMVWHGSMVVLGAYLLFSGYVEVRGKTLFRAFPVFISAVAVAIFLNEFAFRCGLSENHDFNMFFISPYCEPSLPVFSLIQRAVPTYLSIIIYVLGFLVGAYLLLLLVGAVKNRSFKRMLVKKP